jgi:hypothetical protein
MRTEYELINLEKKNAKQLKKRIAIAKRQVKTVKAITSNYSSLARAKSFPRASKKKLFKKSDD